MERTDLIRLPEVVRMTGLSRSEIYRRIAMGQFPKQRKLGLKVAVWRRGDILDYCEMPYLDDDARGLV